MSDLRVQATVVADGTQATVELKKLVGGIADAKIAIADSKAETARLKAELKGLNQTTAEGAARANELKEALRASTAAEVEAAAAAGRANAAYRGMQQGLGGVATSAGQVRAATANLGQQIGDIGQGLALGIQPATIFAQQAGQVGFALSGMGGALGTVGTFLSGPFGAALTVGIIGLGVLASTHDKAASAADGQAAAQKALKASLDDLDSASGRLNRTTEESIRLGTAAADAALKEAQANRTKLQTKLELARAEIEARNRQAADPNNANEAGVSIAGALAGQAAGKVADITAQIAKNAADQATLTAQILGGAYKTAVIAATAATDAKAKANLEFERTETRVKAAVVAGSITQQQAEQQLVAAINKRDAATNAVRESTKAASAATREHNAALRDAERDAAKTAAAIKRLADQYDELFRKSKPPAVNSLSSGEGLDPLGKITDRLDDQHFEKAGKKAAEGFTAGSLADAAAIGQAIGGSAGRVFSSIAALGFGTKNDKGVTSDLTGVGGKLTSLLQPLGDVFGSGGKKFASLVGTAAGGAATGSVVSGIGTALGIKNSKVGASIGGALGAASGIPGGELIGSILGGLVGNLFVKPKTGSASISNTSSSAGKSGNNAEAISNAVGLAGKVQTALEGISQSLGGSVKDFGKLSVGSINGYYGVNLAGDTIGKSNSVGFGNSANSAADAMNYAITVALDRGAIANLSPRVLATLKSYSDNVERGLSEALKVKGLEDLLSDRKNPFAGTFRTLELQLKQRVDVASKYGFDLVEIEKINGEDRAKVVKDTLQQATGSVRALLNDLTFGSKATGSPTERLAGLTTERDRLTGLVKGGDTSQLDAVANVIQQIDELQKTAFGATAGFASGRADNVALLNDLIKQTEDRINAASAAAKGAGDATVSKLTELNASADDQVALLTRNNALLTQIAGSIGGGGGGVSFALSEQFARA